MEVLNRAYKGLRSFVDQFANSTTSIDPTAPTVENRTAWYAEKDDNYMGELLENSLTKSILRKVADSYYGEQLEELFDEATELTPETYPVLHGIYASCCGTLGMHIPPKAYVTGEMKGVNALSLEVERKQFIQISPKVAICLSPEEQSFILGHELSHHQQGNLVCHTVNGLMDNLTNASEIFGPLLLDAIEVPMKRWCRRSEFNADRAGFLCCREIDTIHRLFVRLGMELTPSAYTDYMELESSHPTLYTRWNVLKEYIEKKHR